MFTLKNIVTRVGLAIGVLGLAACGSLSNVTSQGTTDEPVWPDPADVTFNSGSYPEIDNLRLIDAGMTKDQLYNLLGRPHFSEGLFGVHEWDYLFHFRAEGGDVTCQYKVLFDKHMLAQSFFWNTPQCDALVNGTAQSYSLEGDVSFGFDSVQLTDKGQSAIAQIAEQIKSHPNAAVTVIGHTDNIGSSAYNMKLSEQRAISVHDELVFNGIAVQQINVLGKGATEPVVSCANSSQSALINCLAPNRRVDIIVSNQSK